jgi:hypothetical protein
MSKEKRLSEEYAAESFEGSLIRAAKSDGPGRARRDKILVGLGIPPVAIFSEPPASVVAAPGAGKGVLAKWLLIGAVAAVVPVSAWLIGSGAQPDAPPPATKQIAVVDQPRVEEKVREAKGTDPANTAPVVTLEALPLEEDGAPAASRSKQERKASPEPVPSADRDTFREELAAIQHARATLRAGDAGRALAELDAYQKKFKTGHFAQEARLLRIEAFVKQGRREEAKALARPFLEGKSPYAARVRSLVGE